MTFNVRGRKLHGLALVLTEDGLPRALITYAQGQRDGPLRIWDESGRMLLYSEYKNDNQLGITCWCQAGLPLLIEEWGTNRTAKTCLVEYRRDVPQVLPADKLDADQTKRLEAAKVELEKLNDQLKDDEPKWRLDFSTWRTSVTKEMDGLKRSKNVERLRRNFLPSERRY